jgi:hypothetical protein
MPGDTSTHTHRNQQTQKAKVMRVIARESDIVGSIVGLVSELIVRNLVTNQATYDRITGHINRTGEDESDIAGIWIYCSIVSHDFVGGSVTVDVTDFDTKEPGCVSIRFNAFDTLCYYSTLLYQDARDAYWRSDHSPAFA